MYRVFSIALFTLLSVACTIQPATDYQVGQDFSQYHHYAFVAGADDAVQSLDEQRIKAELAAQLEQKGLQMVAAEQADLLVDYRVDSASELEALGGSFSVGFGSRHSAIGMSSPDRYKERKYGKLVVELLDQQNQTIVWRSISQSQLKETMGPESRAKFIAEQITLMLAQYPPQPR
ncbi:MULTISPECIES: DUF4136 domain-containing protein [unclassified Agarivorans]|uniref:DUF4136 domain-containing protein n=1 Tax=unclassified Agarivorans TaxID=2636026 RepID=UPI003D7CA012